MIKVTNDGDSATDALLFAPSGTNVDQFTLGNGCTGTLAPRATCFVTAQFAPTTTGDEDRAFDVSASHGGSVGVDLSGTGTAARHADDRRQRPSQRRLRLGAHRSDEHHVRRRTRHQRRHEHHGHDGGLDRRSAVPRHRLHGHARSQRHLHHHRHIKPAVGGTISPRCRSWPRPAVSRRRTCPGRAQPGGVLHCSRPSGFNFGSTSATAPATVHLHGHEQRRRDVERACALHVHRHQRDFLSRDQRQLLHADGGGGRNVHGPSRVQAAVSRARSARRCTSTTDRQPRHGKRRRHRHTYWEQETLPLPSGPTTAPALDHRLRCRRRCQHVYAAGEQLLLRARRDRHVDGYTINTVGIHADGNRAGLGHRRQLGLPGVRRRLLALDGAACGPRCISRERSLRCGPHSPATTRGRRARRQHASTPVGGMWPQDTTLPATARIALWATSDNDVWLGGDADIRRGAHRPPGIAMGRRRGHRLGRRSSAIPARQRLPTITSLWGFGAPTSTLFVATRPVAAMSGPQRAMPGPRLETCRRIWVDRGTHAASIWGRRRRPSGFRAPTACTSTRATAPGTQRLCST